MSKRLFLALGAGLLGALFISLLQSPVTKAASVYDNTIQTATGTDLYTENKQYCSEELKHMFTSYSLGEAIGTKSNWQQQNEYDSQLSSFKNAESYVILVEKNTASKTSQIYALWRDSGSIDTAFYKNSDASFTWLDATNSDLKLLLVGMNPLDCSKDYVSYTQVNGHTISGIVGSSTYLTYVTNNINIEYPSDYDGDRLPREKTDLRPDFEYTVANKTIKAKDYTFDLPQYTPDEGWTTKGWQLAWHLFKCTDGWDDISKNCEGGSELVNSQFLKQSSDYRFDVADYGDYMLTAGYRIEQCYRYPSYPDTPDYCIVATLVDEFEDYDFKDTSVHLKIDGNSYSGDTKGMVCDVSGSCESRAKMCYLETTFIKRLACEFNNSVDIGVLNPSINAFKDILQSLTVPNNPTCSVPIGNVSVAGQVFPLSSYSSTACQKVKQMRDTFPILAVLTNFMLAMLWLYLVVRMVNKLTDNTQHELIEGIKS